MKINLFKLGIEVTRRCNQRCDRYCMRGPTQDLDFNDTRMIDHIFESNDFGYIKSINFSGGEPTLNPAIIVYTINKIIENNLDVREVVMVTNGLKYNPEIVKAFKKFNEYRNARVLPEIREMYSDLEERILNDQLEINTDEHARVTFSTDQFHRPIKPEVIEIYHREGKGIRFTETGEKKEQYINQAGYSNNGKEIDYLESVVIMPDGKNSLLISGTIYVTATGHYAVGGDGEYTKMDEINCGHITDVTIHNVIANFGSTKDEKLKTILESWKNHNQINNLPRKL